MTIDELLMISAGLLTGMMRAGFGGGVGVVAAPVLALTIPAKQALGVILPLTLSADLISVRYYWGRWEWHLVKAIIPGCVTGIAIGAILLNLIPEEMFRRMIGGMALSYALLQAFGGSLQARLQTTTSFGSLLIGIATGIVSVLLHAGGVVMMLYLAPLRLAGRVFVATAFLIGVILNIFKSVPYVGLGLINGNSLLISLKMLPALAVGAVVGIILNHKLPRIWFHRLILLIVVGVGIRLLLS